MLHFIDCKETIIRVTKNGKIFNEIHIFGNCVIEEGLNSVAVTLEPLVNETYEQTKRGRRRSLCSQIVINEITDKWLRYDGLYFIVDCEVI